MRRAGPGRVGGATTRVKICGITAPEDAALAEQCGAHAVGLIYVPESPRYVGADPSIATRILNALGPFVVRVAVVRRLSDAASLPDSMFDAVQFYEDDMPDGTCMPERRIRCERVATAPTGGASAATTGPSRCERDHAVLIDAYDPERLGGTGRAIGWRTARAIVERTTVPVILAGGLTPETVAEAIRAVRPYGVDVSSGVESRPGTKDPEKMRAFIQAVTDADWSAPLAEAPDVEPTEPGKGPFA